MPTNDEKSIETMASRIIVGEASLQKYVTFEKKQGLK